MKTLEYANSFNCIEEETYKVVDRRLNPIPAAVQKLIKSLEYSTLVLRSCNSKKYAVGMGGFAFLSTIGLFYNANGDPLVQTCSKGHSVLL